MLFLKKRKYMSTTTDNFERELTSIISNFSGKSLPSNIPSWVQTLGITTTNHIVKAERIGSSGYKTDIVVHFDNNSVLKISAKMSSADYFGNWYSHTRVLEEFGSNIFTKLTRDCTQWANDWINHKNASLFVGVSVCFGKRIGDTSRDFSAVFNSNDIIKIVAGTGKGLETTNCLYSTSDLPNSIEHLFTILKPINASTISALSKDFKIAYRPINPMTEGSNRGKCVYTQFIPHESLLSPTKITTLTELNALGKFEIVSENSLNHNRVLNGLRDNFNIDIPRKP